jgi:hypothetical protein
MEQITTFVLGAISALGLFGLGYGIFTALKINKITSKQQEDIKHLYSALKEIPKVLDEKIKEIHENHHRRMDEICDVMEDRQEDIFRRIDELNRYVDSRFDKQADKAATTFSNVNNMIYDKVEKLEELFKIQMDQFAKVTLNHSERLAELETSRKIEEDKIEQINS